MKLSKNAIGNRRRNMTCRLAIEWLKSNRPDVKEIIDKEVNKKYPLSSRSSIQLPNSLREKK